jgi:DNA-directed RNA polymerase specialized sigma24 family protein
VRLHEALHELVPGEPEDDEVDQAVLVAAAREAWRRRHVNTQAGAAVLAALVEKGLSYRQIADSTGIPAATAHRWARPPEQDTE